VCVCVCACVCGRACVSVRVCVCVCMREISSHHYAKSVKNCCSALQQCGYERSSPTNTQRLRMLTWLQPAATHCNPLHPTATRCNKYERLPPTNTQRIRDRHATHCNALQHNTVQYTCITLTASTASRSLMCCTSVS